MKNEELKVTESQSHKVTKFVRLKFHERSEMKFGSRTIPPFAESQSHKVIFN